MYPIDITAVIPEAQPIVQAAAEILIRRTAPWFIGLVAHGSAVKGGFIPGSSDVDLQLFLEDAAYTDDELLPLVLCADIHRELARIPPAPFEYLQCLVFRAQLRESFTGPIPGAYAVIAGRLPVPEASATVLMERSRAALERLRPPYIRIADGLLSSGAGILERHVRTLTTAIWPTLYQLLTVRTADPLRIWRLPKPEVIALIPEDEEAGQAIRNFDRALRRYIARGRTVDDALATIAAARTFLDTAKQSWLVLTTTNSLKEGDEGHDQNIGRA